MKKLVAIFLVIILAGSITIPNVFSDNEKNNNNNDNNNQQNDNKKSISTNENGKNTNENNNHQKDNQDKIHFGFSNATSIHFTLLNGTTLTFAFSNGTNAGQQISAFVHTIHDIFKQQADQAKKIIKDCREKAKNASTPAEKKNILNECKAKLKEIKQQFKNEQKQFQMDLRQLRGMVIGSNQENHEKLSMPKNDTKLQNKTQTFEKRHGHEQNHKQHGNQGKDNLKKHDRQD